jgi:hypothetical protein
MLKSIHKILLLIFLIFSCKKEKKDDVFPVINVSNPQSNSYYHFNDTIKINLKASDENELSKIEVYISDQNGSTVLNSFSQSYSGIKSKELELQILINDIHLNSGNYIINAEAYDGTNITTVKIPIYIEGIPNKLTHFFAQIFQNNNHLLLKYDTTFNFIREVYRKNTFFSYSLNSWLQHVYIADNLSLKCIEISSMQVIWQNQINGINNSFCVSDENSVFVSLANGNCAEFSHQGSLRRSYLTNETDYLIKNLFIAGNYLVINLQNRFNNFYYKTIIFEKGSSLIKSALSDNFIYKKGFKNSQSELFMLSENTGSQSKIVKWNPISGLTQDFYVSSSPIYDAVLTDNDQLVISFSDGTTKQVSLIDLNWMNLNSGNYYKQLKYSPITQSVYAYKSGNIDQLKKSSFSLSQYNQFIFNDSLLQLELLNLK